jgi:hypothetical protein
MLAGMIDGSGAIDGELGELVGLLGGADGVGATQVLPLGGSGTSDAPGFCS